MLFSSIYSKTAANFIVKILNLKLATISGLPLLQILLISIILFVLIYRTINLISSRPPLILKNITSETSKGAKEFNSQLGNGAMKTPTIEALNTSYNNRSNLEIGIKTLTHLN